MRCFATIAVGLLCLGAASAAPFASCTEDCIDFILTSSAGPKVLRLYKELLKHDSIPGSAKVDINGQSYPVSYSKKNLIDNAIRKGVPEKIIETMLDDAAIIPTGPASSSSGGSSFRPSEFDRPHRPDTTTQVHERRPTTSTNAGSYRIHTTNDGGIAIDIRGETLRIPDELSRLSQIVEDSDMLYEIVSSLQSFGVPIRREGNRIITTTTPTASSSSSRLQLRVSIRKAGDTVESVTVHIGNDKYVLPSVTDEFRLNRYLQQQPDVAYQLLKILSAHKVPVDYDATTKTLKTRFESSDNIGSRTTIPDRHTTNGRHPSGPSADHLETEYTRPSATNRKIIRVGSYSYYLPDDWDRLKRDMQDGKVSSTTVLDVLDTNRIYAPAEIMTLIRSRISTSASKVRVMRYGDDITIELGGKSYKLPSDTAELSKALRENEFPVELIRDSLLRIGVDSRRVGSSLRVVLPGGEAFLANLPTTRQYDYKITSAHDSVEIVAGSDTYTLPRDQTLLERAIAEKKVLPRTLVDAFNGVGMLSTMDINNQEMSVQLPLGNTIKLAVPLNISKHQEQQTDKRVRLQVRGAEGSRIYLVTIGDDNDNDKFELPAEISGLNQFIRSGKVSSELIIRLLERMSVSHTLDSVRNVHKITLNGKTYELENSASSSGGHQQRRLF